MYQWSSDHNIGKMKIPKMTNSHFQWPTFCKRLTDVTLIFNDKVAISGYSRKCKNQIFHMASILYT